jgi:hypothetical protein
MTDESEQLKLPLNAETTFFHVFRSMFGTGDVKKMGVNAYAIYGALKYHADFKTGEAYPGIPVLMGLTGVGRKGTMDALEVLVAMGYCTKTRRGRAGNEYLLREKIAIEDAEGAIVAQGSFDYMPLGIKRAVHDLKHVLLTGDLNGAKIINIERLTINVLSDNAYQVNGNVTVGRGGDHMTAEEILAEMDRLPPAQRAALRSAFVHHQNRKETAQ